jgi:hypothetical protein
LLCFFAQKPELIIVGPIVR